MSFPTKTSASPIALLQQFVTLTGRKFRYLQIDGAEEFQYDEIKEYCAENDVVLYCVVATIRCKPAYRVQLAASNSIAKRLCYTRTSPHVSRMTRLRISASRKYTYGLYQIPAASLRHLMIACNWFSAALTKPLLYLSAAESSLNCLVSTARSRTDHWVIVSLKAHTSIVTPPPLACGCLASSSNARSKCKISSPISSIPFQRPVMSYAQHSNNDERNVSNSRGGRT